ncbi:hypothetical protein BP5796_09823 [Coleophoma crateriformis]|uniref:DUF7908 domain-containing protein n=1 Tax=Coleophoma crateriformis TaxID=565419 RepID=A0A3D8QZR9_9HELO|nr:hypothetical protein BP5796_09823 [Coleophoma crateriformis]
MFKSSLLSTIININGGLTININNAPIQLVTTLNATSIVTITSTITTDTIVTATATTTPIEQSFVFSIVAEATSPVVAPRKRQELSQNFVGAGGSSGNRCKDAPIFTIRNGQLFEGNQKLSTNVGVSQAQFETSSANRTISTIFSLNTQELL